jgi:hypothetical protein
MLLVRMIRLLKWPFAMPSLLRLHLFCHSVLSVVTTQSFCYEPRHGRRRKRKRNKDEDSDSSDPEFEDYFDELIKEEKGKLLFIENHLEPSIVGFLVAAKIIFSCRLIIKCKQKN